MSCQSNHPLLLVFGAISLVVLNTAAAPSNDFFNNRIIHAQNVNSTDIIPYIENDYERDIAPGNEISSTGNYIALNNQGVYAELINPTRVLTLSIQGTRVFLNSRVVCNDIQTLSRNNTYQKTRGSMWYTNLKVGKPMSEEEIVEFKNKLKEAREERSKTSDLNKQAEQGHEKDGKSGEEGNKKIGAGSDASTKSTISMEEITKRVAAELEAERKAMEANKQKQDGSEADSKAKEDAEKQLKDYVISVTTAHAKALREREEAIARAIYFAQHNKAAKMGGRVPEEAITKANNDSTADGRVRDEKCHMRRQQDEALMRKRGSPRKWASCSDRT